MKKLETKVKAAHSIDSGVRGPHPSWSLEVPLSDLSPKAVCSLQAYRPESWGWVQPTDLQTWVLRLCATYRFTDLSPQPGYSLQILTSLLQNHMFDLLKTAAAQASWSWNDITNIQEWNEGLEYSSVTACLLACPQQDSEFYSPEPQKKGWLKALAPQYLLPVSDSRVHILTKQNGNFKNNHTNILI